jgi:hypothetical protein
VFEVRKNRYAVITGKRTGVRRNRQPVITALERVGPAPRRVLAMLVLIF